MLMLATMPIGSETPGHNSSAPSEIRETCQYDFRRISLDGSPPIMVGSRSFILQGGEAIGIKAFFIEHERNRGRDGFALRVRETQPVLSSAPSRDLGEAGECRPGVDDGSVGYKARETGSEALGLRECKLLIYEPENVSGCSYSRLVCVGFEARVARIRYKNERQ